MKKFYILLPFIILTTISIHAQDFPTRGEIYNYEVGDIFHTKFFGISPGFGMSDKQNIEIIIKFYSDNMDTVYYGRHIEGNISTSDNPDDAYYDDYDTVFFANLEDVFIADSVFEDNNYFNGRKTIYSDHYDELEYTYTSSMHTIGCGQVYDEWDCNDPENSTYAEFELVYFKKGDEEWGEEQVIVGTPEISKKQRLKIFPNPTTDYLNISCNDAIANSSILIFNTNGQLQLSKKLNAHNERISVSGLPSGVYLAQQIDSGGNIIARMKFVNK